MARPTPLALLVLAGLALPAITGGAAAADEEPELGALDADMEVTAVLRAVGASTDQYAFAVELTNPAAETTYVHHLELTTATGRHDNECPESAGGRIEPGQAETLTGCYTLPTGEDPVGITILGTTDPNAEHPDLGAVLPFTAEFSESCRTGTYGHQPDVCLPAQTITTLIQDVDPGDASTGPSQATTPPGTDRATTPAQPIEDTFISQASYDHDTNRLILNLTQKFNPFLVDMTKISIEDEPCAITLTWQEYDAHAPDRLAIIIKPNDLHRETLAKMDQPAVRAFEGAFVSPDDGKDLGWAGAWLEVTGDAPGDRTPCAITYGFNDPLLRVYAVNYTEMLQAVRDGFNVWSDLNPHLSFVQVEQNPLIRVNWIEYTPDHIGLACLDCLIYGASMDVSLYDYNCRGERIHREPDYVRNIIAHELGHILGLEHHGNKTHLMYGPEHIQDPYQTLGYAIPDRLLPERFIGERAMWGQLTEFNLTLAQIESDLDELGAAIDRFRDRNASRIDGDTVYFNTQSEVNQYSRMINKYNGLVEEHNALLNEYIGVAGEINCMYEPPPSARP